MIILAPMGEEKLRNIFADVLQVPSSEISDATQYQKIARWDSVSHMQIIGRIEEEFDIMLDTDDIIGMSTFLKAKEIAAKYGVEL